MNQEITDLASRWKRLGGVLIDALIIMAIMVPIGLATGVWQQLASGQQMTIGQLAVQNVVGLVVFLLLNGYLLFKKGQTIGKVVVKTRIVDLSDNVPSIGKLIVLRYLILSLAFQILILVGFVALADAVPFADALFIFGKKRRCIHDYIAGTRVINA